MKQVLDRTFLSSEKSEPFSHAARQRKTLNIMLLCIGFACVAMIVSMLILDLAHTKYTGRELLYFGVSVTLVGTIFIALIERFVSTSVASLIFMIMISITILLSDKPIEYVEGQSIIFLVFPVVIAGLLLRPWAGYVVAAIVDVGEVVGFFVFHTGIPNIGALIMMFILAWIIQQSTSSLERAVEQEQKKSHALSESEKAIIIQNRRIQEISRKLLEVQEKEKHLLAAELHDDLGQSLTSLKLMLELSTRAGSSANRQKKMAEARELVSDLMNKVRNLSLDLRPAMLDDFGLFKALRWLFDRFQSRTGISVICNVDLDDKQRFEPPVETAAFRIIQEALTNIARHASVREAQVTISTGEVLHIEIADKGAGFDVTEALPETTKSAGLSGMQERARLLGGLVEFSSEPGEGTRVIAAIPLTGVVQ